MEVCSHNCLKLIIKFILNLFAASIQIVGMSATIQNLGELASFLKSNIYTREFRPVELKEYVKSGADILSFDSRQSEFEDAFAFTRSMGKNYDQKMSQRDPDHLTELVEETAPKDAVLIFCSTKVNCESVALLLVETLPSKWKDYKQDEKKNLMLAIKGETIIYFGEINHSNHLF